MNPQIFGDLEGLRYNQRSACEEGSDQAGMAYDSKHFPRHPSLGPSAALTHPTLPDIGTTIGSKYPSSGASRGSDSASFTPSKGSSARARREAPQDHEAAEAAKPGTSKWWIVKKDENGKQVYLMAEDGVSLQYQLRDVHRRLLNLAKKVPKERRDELVNTVNQVMEQLDSLAIDVNLRRSRYPNPFDSRRQGIGVLDRLNETFRQLTSQLKLLVDSFTGKKLEKAFNQWLKDRFQQNTRPYVVKQLQKYDTLLEENAAAAERARNRVLAPVPGI